MASQLRIDCVTTSTRTGNITHVGGPNYQGRRWKWPVDTVIGLIVSQSMRFYVYQHGTQTRVVAVPRNGRYYIRTEADSASSNNLLSLNHCR